jgi:hypothetical protein
MIFNKDRPKILYSDFNKITEDGEILQHILLDDSQNILESSRCYQAEAPRDASYIEFLLPSLFIRLLLRILWVWHRRYFSSAALSTAMTLVEVLSSRDLVHLILRLYPFHSKRNMTSVSGLHNLKPSSLVLYQAISHWGINTSISACFALSTLHSVWKIGLPWESLSVFVETPLNHLQYATNHGLASVRFAASQNGRKGSVSVVTLGRNGSLHLRFTLWFKVFGLWRSWKTIFLFFEVWAEFRKPVYTSLYRHLWTNLSSREASEMLPGLSVYTQGSPTTPSDYRGYDCIQVWYMCIPIINVTFRHMNVKYKHSTCNPYRFFIINLWTRIHVLFWVVFIPSTLKATCNLHQCLDSANKTDSSLLQPH